MNKLIKLSILNIRRNHNKINTLIILLFMSLISIVFSISILLNQDIGSENYILVSEQLLGNELKIIKNITNIVNFIFFIILFLAAISISIMLKKIVEERIQEIALYKSIGYKNIDLFKLIFYELLIIIIYSYIISTILSILILYFLKVQYLYMINIKLNLLNIILIYTSILILWVLLILIISLILIFEMKNIPPILLFNE